MYTLQMNMMNREQEKGKDEGWSRIKRRMEEKN